MFTRAAILAAAVSAVAMINSAKAADAVVEVAEEVVAIEPSFSWTGLYVGGNVGYTWGSFDHSSTLQDVEIFAGIPPFVPAIILPGFSDSVSSNGDGISGGAQIGYNWQVNQFVFGVEADIQAADVEAGYSTSDSFLGLADINTNVSTKLDWFGSARLRAGFVPTERLLVYGTGGFAFGRTKSEASLQIDPILGPDFNGQVSESKTRTGWTAGAGAEYALTTNWTLKGEYLYTDLGKEEFFKFNQGPVDFTLDSEVKFHTVRLGVNYKF